MARAAATVALVAGAMVPALMAAPAHAAPGDPFDGPSLFISQYRSSANADGPIGTRLWRVTDNGDGSASKVLEGSVWAGARYKAIAYNTADNYLYGVVYLNGTAAFPVGALVRIGEGNVVTRVGSEVFANRAGGTFGPDGLYYVVGGTGSAIQRQISVIDVSTGTLVRTITMTPTTTLTTSPDIVHSHGYLWLAGSSRALIRIDPVTGAVSTFSNVLPATIPTGSAAWATSSGNIAFLSTTATPDFAEIEISNAGSASPTFTVVKTGGAGWPEQASAAGDAAGWAGAPAGASAPLTQFTSPAADAVYEVDEEVIVDFTCDPAAISCAGTQEPGELLDTSAPGTYVFTVIATYPGDIEVVEAITYSVAEVVGAPMVSLNAAVAVALALAAGAGAMLVLRRRSPGDLA